MKQLTDYNLKKGDTIEIIRMTGEPEYTGRRGVISHIDDAGNIHGTWGSLSIIPETDLIIKIEGEEDNG